MKIISLLLFATLSVPGLAEDGYEEEAVKHLVRSVRVDAATIDACTFEKSLMPSQRAYAWTCVIDAKPPAGEVLRVEKFEFEGPNAKLALPTTNKWAKVGRAALSVTSDVQRTTITMRPELNDEYRGYMDLNPNFTSREEAVDLAKQIVGNEPDGVIKGVVRMDVKP